MEIYYIFFRLRKFFYAGTCCVREGGRRGNVEVRGGYVELGSGEVVKKGLRKELVFVVVLEGFWLRWIRR